jgi:hypothetical protein
LLQVVEFDATAGVAASDVVGQWQATPDDLVAQYGVAGAGGIEGGEFVERGLDSVVGVAAAIGAASGRRRDRSGAGMGCHGGTPREQMIEFRCGSARLDRINAISRSL